MTRLLRSAVLLCVLALASACGQKAAQSPATTSRAPPATTTAAAAGTPAVLAPEPAVVPTVPAEATPTPAEVAPAAAAVAPEDDVRDLSTVFTPWKGDFDQMVERRQIRVLVPYNRTLYFSDKGTERGLTAETVRDFEKYINKKYRKDKRPITVMIIPATRDRLIPEVAAGLGDIAAGNLTVTEARLKQVDFYAPDDQKLHQELVVTGPDAVAVNSIEDLSGKTVSVRPSSSYFESLTALNQRFATEKKAQIDIQRLPDALEDEDILEMVNAGLLNIVVVDDWKASLWSQVLPNIRVHESLAVRSGAKIGWAIRKDSPQLAAAIEDFRKNYLVKQGVAAYRIAQYQKRFKQITNPTRGDDERRFDAIRALFYEYGDKYGFDPIMLAAQGYQESRLDQEAKSHVGAVGVMQVMPATGKELGVGDIRQVGPNIHAGAKYMDQLMTRYFKDANFDEQNRSLFAFAAYNAGPGRIQQMRSLARERGLNPDVWFNNVEVVTAEKVGMETTTYVRNIYKYYVAYKLSIEARAAQRKAKELVAPAARP